MATQHARPTGDTALDALGNPVRRAIISLLAEGPRPVAEIATAFPVSGPAISKPLKILEAADLGAFDTRGTRNIYRLDTRGFEAARGWLDGFWDETLTRLKIAAENLDPGDGDA